MRAYSTDLREKIVLAYEGGEVTFDEIADTFGVARCTVGRLLKLARSGDSLAPLPHGGGYPASLDEKRLILLRAQVWRRPDATLEELAAYLKKRCRVLVLCHSRFDGCSLNL
jgi:transposase